MHRFLVAAAALAVAFPSVAPAQDRQLAETAAAATSMSVMPERNPHGHAQPAPDRIIVADQHHQHGDEAMPHGPMTGEGTYRFGDLTVEIPWARATAGRAGGAFMMIHNSGHHGDRLVGASSDVAGRIELHATVMQDGVMKMRQVEGGVEVPADGMAELKPGGFHVMMMGLAGPLEEGGSFPLTLTFERAGTVTVEVMVRPAGAMDSGTQHHN